MNIGIMTDKPSLEGIVPPSFSEAEHLLIVDADSGALKQAFNRCDTRDNDLAQKLLDWDCEAVICGPIEKESFLLIADRGCITRYYGVGLTATDALSGMNLNRLPFIVDYIGGTGCAGDHTSCDCGDKA